MAHGSHASLLSFATHHGFGLKNGFSNPSPPPLVPVFPLPAHALHMRPHSSVASQYRNLHLLSIGYALKPRLRSRLTQGRSALPWNPWIFGRKDSHLPLATHSGILSCSLSTKPLSFASSFPTMLLYQPVPFRSDSSASVLHFSPGHFRRTTSRLVSYYALFQRMAASKPTS